MKKLIFSLTVFTGLLLGFGANAQNDSTAQGTTRMKFYYYPSSNVYYDIAGNQYWYWDNTSNNWMEGTTLPTTITLVKSPRYIVYHNDANVWQDNAAHQKKYKLKNN